MEAASLTRHERVRELLLAASFLAAATALATLAEPAREWEVARAVLLVAVFAVAARVELDVGQGYTVPTQLVFVPMLLLLPTTWVPLLVAAGWLLAKLSEVVTGRIHPERAVVALGNSWFAVGPAVVLVLLDAERPEWDMWPAYLLALGAQFAGDLAAAALREGARVVRPLLSGVYLIDVLLTGPALLAAFASRDARYAFLGVLPGVALFVIFGRERTHRLADALALAERSEQAAGLSARLLESEREATRVREGVLAGASTEMLQPLSRLTALIYRVRRDDDAERAGHLAEMEREIQQLRHNAGQFIDYSVLKAGRELAITPRRTDLTRIIRGAVAAWPPSAKVTADLPPDDLPPAMADDGRVLQMLMSLISNAVKFSPPRAPVEVTARVGEEAIAISVSDQGPGIPERERDRIFHELRRGSTAAGTEGAGLGLYLCRRIAEASGGELLVRTDVGSGSTFTIVLPRA